MLELVAPAGDLDSFRLAVAHGADAVYLGLKAFSARQYAANFDLSGLEALVRLAHLHRVRVYVTMNTLLREDELGSALDQARQVHAAGADAIILQDLGFLVRLRQELPEMPLHASTQTTIANSETVAAIGRLGLARLILAREAHEDEVKAMAAIGPEIEIFVHGALCFSYSGQCLMSSLIGGRSGNRGRCAQPCRLEYSLAGTGGPDLAADTGKYLLSPRDLCLLPHLGRLQAAGVKALKIEGRMKRPEYVGTVVRIYRQALDRLAADPEKFRALPEEERELEQIFNRGFTPGMFLGDQGASYQSFRRPNNRGLLVGRVSAVDRAAAQVSLALSESIRVGDGLEFWVTKGGRAGTVIERMTVAGRPVEEAEAGEVATIPWHDPASAGDRVFRTSDAELNAKAWAPLAGGADPAVPFWAQISLAPGESARLTLTDDEGRSVEVRSEAPGQVARNRPLSEEMVREHLGRTGGSGWFAQEIRVELAPETMFPLSVLNQLRRSGLAALESARLAAWPGAKLLSPIPPPAFSAPAGRQDDRRKLSATVGSPEEAGAAMEAGADRLYLASWLHAWPDDELGKLKALAGARTQLIYALPRVVPEKELAFFRRELTRVDDLGLDGWRLPDLGMVELAPRQEWGRSFLDFSLNVMNSSALRFLAGKAAAVALSPELTLTQARDLARTTPGSAEIMVHGRLEMMISAQCVLGAAIGGKDGTDQACRRPCEKGQYVLRDRLGFEFPLIGDRFCRLHLENSLDLSLLPELDRVCQGDYDLRLELHGRGSRYARTVVSAYREGLARVEAGDWTRAWGEEAEAGLRGFSPAGFTRGHFFRGVE